MLSRGPAHDRKHRRMNASFRLVTVLIDHLSDLGGSRPVVAVSALDGYSLICSVADVHLFTLTRSRRLPRSARGSLLRRHLQEPKNIAIRRSGGLWQANPPAGAAQHDGPPTAANGLLINSGGRPAIPGGKTFLGEYVDRL